MLAGLKLCCVFPTMAKEVLTFCCLVLYIWVIGVESRSTHPSSIPTTPRYPTMGPSTTCHVDGNVYNKGDMFKLSPCITCWCSGDYNEYTGYPYWCCGTSCQRPRCVDAIRPPGECCWTCPNGDNCFTPWGEIMSSSLVNETLGLTCYCDQDYYDYGFDPDTYTPESVTATCYDTDSYPY